MAQHVLFRLRRVGVAVSALITFSLLPTAAVNAEPVPPPGDTAVTQPQPTTATQAQAAWMQAEERAEHLNEQLLQAGIDVNTAAATVATADAEVAASAAAVTESAARSAAAQALVDTYSTQLDAFAGASFKGARADSLTALLTADSADDYLDSVVALDRVAAANNTLLEDARTARTAADAAGAELAARQAQAITSQATAVAARDAAVAAQATLTATQADFTARVTEYQTLYNELSEAERLAALAAEEERLAAEATVAAAANPDDAVAAAIAGTTTEATSAAPPSGAMTGPLAPAANAAAQAAVEAALSKVGSRYVWGAAGPDQFDCSGLTSWAWKQAGVTIPRVSGSQAGLPVVPLDQLQPGDLITYYSPVSHVAMYIGAGQIVQASTASKPVFVTTVAKGGPNPVGHRVG